MHQINTNGRFFADENGQPFFYLADTAWFLFYKLDRSDVNIYLQNRVDKGFSVVMPVILREAGTKDGNVYGNLPLINNDPTCPNEKFFEHVNWVIEQAVSKGLSLALLPTWGEYVGPLWMGDEEPENFNPDKYGPTLFDVNSAQAYGKFLGKRYRDMPVIWVLGGDRNPVEKKYQDVWRAMADGLDSGGQGRHLMTYHPCRPSSSSRWFHKENWLDFNMMQTSTLWDFDNWRMILDDYNREPLKPVLDGEPRYEDSYERFHIGRPSYGRRISAHQVRKAAYNAILSGAAGHTYGCRDVWSFYTPDDDVPARDVKSHWKRAMDFPGAYQMGYLRDLLTNYPFHKLIPDQEHQLVTYGYEQRAPHAPAAISKDNDFALVYFPEHIPLWIDTTLLKGNVSSAYWFDPTCGQTHWIGDYQSGTQQFEPEFRAPNPDFVLILESKNNREERKNL